MEWNTKYYLTDRYYCFVVDGLAGDSVDLLYKDIRSIYVGIQGRSGFSREDYEELGFYLG